MNSSKPNKPQTQELTSTSSGAEPHESSRRKKVASKQYLIKEVKWKRRTGFKKNENSS